MLMVITCWKTTGMYKPLMFKNPDTTECLPAGLPPKNLDPQLTLKPHLSTTLTATSECVITHVLTASS